ncbi:hypothetical protein BVRB_039210, partial [Beta vulgaris subsp. vulgaris]
MGRPIFCMLLKNSLSTMLDFCLRQETIDDALHWRGQRTVEPAAGWTAILVELPLSGWRELTGAGIRLSMVDDEMTKCEKTVT